jgi:hypothetical protein
MTVTVSSSSQLLMNAGGTSVAQLDNARNKKK